MARQESQSKLLYYPTSLEVISLLATWFVNPHPSRLSDPCVGEGEALAAFQKAVGGTSETWGVELSYSRVEKAKQVIGTVLPTDFYGVRWAKRTVSFALDNPPYDYSGLVDQRGRRIRHERQFITLMTPRLVEGGQHVMIVPRMMLRDEELARHIVGWYERVLVFGYPDTHFDQLVILAQKRAEYQAPTNDRLLNLMAWGDPGVNLTELCECPGDHRRYTIPPAPELHGDYFSYMPFDHKDQVKLTLAVYPKMIRGLQAGTFVRPVGSAMHPAIPENRGHISMELASGTLGTLLIKDASGSPFLTRGSTKKVVTTSVEVMTNDKGEPTGNKVTEIEKLVSEIVSLSPDGKLVTMSDAGQVGKFVTDNAGALTDALLRRNTPLYSFDPLPEEWDVTRAIGLKYPPLPGREERGLFDVQAHFAIASRIVLKKHHHVFVNADMGTGKTIVDIAAWVLMDKWPVIIMAPGHMLEKHRREAELGADGIVARILDTGARPVVDIRAKAQRVEARFVGTEVIGDRRKWVFESGPKAASSIMNYAASCWLDPKPDDDVEAWTGKLLDEETAAKAAEEDVKNGSSDHRVWSFTCRDSSTSSHYYNVVVPAIESIAWTEGTGDSIARCHAKIVKSFRVHVEPKAKTKTSVGHNGRRRRLTIELPSGYRPQLITTLNSLRLQPEVLERHSDVTVVEFNDRDLYTLFDFVADYKAGLLGRKAVAITGFDSAKYDAGAVTYDGITRKRYKLNKHKPKGQRVETEYEEVCPVCGKKISEYSQEVGYCCNPLEPKLGRKKIVHTRFDGEGHVLRDDKKEPVSKTVNGKPQICGAPLYNFNRWRRVGVARLVRDQFKGFFKVYVADEVHKAQAGSTDIGAADGRLITGTKYSIALTGTLFGGIASSLFYLTYRRVKAVRRLYRYDDVSKWIDHYGAVKRTWFESDSPGQRGRATNIERDRVNTKELPRIHPGIINHLLPQTLFAKITDLGYELPPLYEDIIRVPMSKEQTKAYTLIGESIRDYASRQAAQNKDFRWFSIWFLFMLRWPNAAFRPDKYALRGYDGFDTPGIVDGDNPKDLLPKEKMLIEHVKRSMADGRKTLVFVEETSERDIRPRLKVVLEANISGCNAQVMSSSMAPARREAWIRQNAAAMNVLLVNPKLVETGLDLVMFSDIIFYELTYSLYTLWQAMRRVWRLGQANAVTTAFLVYSGTTEEAGLEWMGSKMKAGMILYGDNAAGALVEETEETDEDFRREMIKKAIAGKVDATVGERVKKLDKVFGGANRPDVVKLVVGNRPTAPAPTETDVLSVIVPTMVMPHSSSNLLDLIERAREGTLLVGKRGAKPKAAAPPPDNQLSLF